MEQEGEEVATLWEETTEDLRVTEILFASLRDTG